MSEFDSEEEEEEAAAVEPEPAPGDGNKDVNKKSPEQLALERINRSRRTLVYQILRYDRKTHEPVGIDATTPRITMKSDQPDLAQGTRQQLGWWDSRVGKQDRDDEKVQKKHFHQFDAFGNEIAFILNHTLEIYEGDSEKIEELRYWEAKRIDLVGKWVMRVIGYNFVNHSWEEHGLELWATSSTKQDPHGPTGRLVVNTIKVQNKLGNIVEVEVPDGTTPVQFVMEKYTQPASFVSAIPVDEPFKIDTYVKGASEGRVDFLSVWTPTWEAQNSLYGSYGVDRKFRRFIALNSDTEVDPISGVRAMIPNSRIGIVNFGMIEWMRLRSIYASGKTKEERDAAKLKVESRFGEYTEEDWQFCVQFSGSQKIVKFLNMSREHKDKTEVAREAERFEWQASLISSSVLLLIRDLVAVEKKQRENRVASNPRLGDSAFDHKAAMAVTLTGFVSDSKTSWLMWAYWFQQAGAGLAPNIYDPVTNTYPDKMVPVTVVFNTWEVFFLNYLERTREDINTPEGWKPRKLPSIGTPHQANLEDTMRILFEHYLWERLCDPQIRIWVMSEYRGHKLTLKDVEGVYDLQGKFRYRQHWLVDGREAEYEQSETDDYRLAEEVYEWHVARQIGDNTNPGNKMGWGGYADLLKHMRDERYYSRVVPKTRWNLLVYEEADWQYNADGTLIVPAIGSERWRGAAILALYAMKTMEEGAHAKVAMTDGIRGYQVNDAFKDIDSGYGMLAGPRRNDARPKHPKFIHEGYMADDSGRQIESDGEWIARVIDRRKTTLATMAWAESIIDKVIFLNRQVALGMSTEDIKKKQLDMVGNAIHPYWLYTHEELTSKYPRFAGTCEKMTHFYLGWLEASMPSVYSDKNPRMMLAASQVWEEMRLTVYELLIPKYKELSQTLGLSRFMVDSPGAEFKKELDLEIASMQKEMVAISKGE